MHKIDRGARNLKHWVTIGELMDQGVDVRFVHDNLDMQTRGGRLTADFIRNLRDEVKKGIQGRLRQNLYLFHPVCRAALLGPDKRGSRLVASKDEISCRFMVIKHTPPTLVRAIDLSKPLTRAAAWCFGQIRPFLGEEKRHNLANLPQARTDGGFNNEILLRAQDMVVWYWSNTRSLGVNRPWTSDKLYHHAGDEPASSKAHLKEDEIRFLAVELHTILRLGEDPAPPELAINPLRDKSE